MTQVRRREQSFPLAVLQRYANMLTPSDGTRIALCFVFFFIGKFFAICVSRRSLVTKQRARCATETTIRADPVETELLTPIIFIKAFLELEWLEKLFQP